MPLTPLQTLETYRAHDYTIHSALLSRASVRPEHAFLVSEKRSISWGDTVVLIDRMAKVLFARGITAGARVAIIARNSDTHVLLLAALSRLGAIMVPTNPDFSMAEAGYVFENARVCAVFCDQETIALARSACRELGIDAWLTTNDEFIDGTPSTAQLPAESAPQPMPACASPENTCIIIYTSGSSGFPKGVMHSQRSFLLSGEVFVERMHLQPDDRMLVVLPMFHINALFYSISGALAAGCTAIITSRFSASKFWSTAVASAATQVNVIEAIGTILANRSREEFRVDHRISKAYGVRPLAAEIFRKDFSVPCVISGYGMTEAPGMISPILGVANKPGSIGLVGCHPDPAQPWAQCRILNEEFRDVQVNEVGQLALKTPNIMQGYFRDTIRTAAAFHDGWFLTGDQVRRDEDGYYFFVARNGDIIRRRGENISAAELDRIICSHPDVYEAAVVPVPCDLGEDDILAAIVPKAGVTLDSGEIVRWCRAYLSEGKVPRYFLFLEKLPHTPTHKIAKMILRKDPSLRERAVDRLASGAP